MVKIYDFLVEPVCRSCSPRSTRVPLPDTLAPQLDEQVLLDSEYMVPSKGLQFITIQAAYILLSIAYRSIGI